MIQTLGTTATAKKGDIGKEKMKNEIVAGIVIVGATHGIDMTKKSVAEMKGKGSLNIGTINEVTKEAVEEVLAAVSANKWISLFVLQKIRPILFVRK